MPGIPDGSLPILTSLLSPATVAKVTLYIIGLVLIIASLYYVSPTRLTRVLSDAMSNLDKLSADILSAGLLGLMTPDKVAAVGMFRAETLLHSLSWRATICEFFKGRSLTLYRCINEVRDLETHIRILEQEHRRPPKQDARIWPPPPPSSSSSQQPPPQQQQPQPQPQTKQSWPPAPPYAQPYSGAQREPYPRQGPTSTSGSSGGNVAPAYRQQGGAMKMEGFNAFYVEHPLKHVEMSKLYSLSGQRAGFMRIFDVASVRLGGSPETFRVAK
ncbi:hypothetical protein C8F04DRAFT_1175539 [Mycena alexandri]|uniref:Uncharacterized protein n=1 Tax=Mycena alexandri TaxID=1745969 RepID=A0AAD6TC11_9AGAR|nr:hypothetical protein C8F04DRAFT_1175539 [Mycena alexandri]